MDYTYLDYFNYYLKEYINELINTFPETHEPLLSNYRSLLENRDDKNDLYVKCFYTKINNFLVPIAKRDETLFQSSGKVFIEGIDLYTIWNNSLATEQTHIAIWKYLQILMILGRKIIPNHKEIIELLQKVSNGNINIPAKVEKTLATDDDETEAPGVFSLGDIASSLGGLGNIASSLGNLGGENGLGNIISNFAQVFNNPEFTNAMSQLSETISTQQQSNNTPDNTQPSATAATSASQSSDNTQQSNESSQTNQPNQFFNNPLIGDLAKELSETFDFEEMERNGKPANIGEALGKFMTGNNPAKLMSLLGKYGSKLQQEVQRGNINPTELLQQTMGAMGSANMARNPQTQQMARNQSTRDRLRAKYEQKQAEKNNK